MKYLFTVLLTNGEYIEQTVEDLSNKASYKSTFYDVLEETKTGNKPVMFCLVGEGNDYLVDLRDGHFEVNGQSVYLHEHDKRFTDYRLIYYRKITKFYNLVFEEILEETAFYFGWQATIDGGNIERVMFIK